MAINPEDFMSTQTGGEGETIQASPDSPQLASQFEANITPQPQPQVEQQLAAPSAPVVETATASLAPREMPSVQSDVMEQTQAKLSPEAMALSQFANLGLVDVDVPTVDDLVPQQEQVQAEAEQTVITARSAKEAKALRDKGYMPMLNGQAISNQDMSIDSQFIGRPYLEMQKQEAPVQTAESTYTSSIPSVSGLSEINPTQYQVEQDAFLKTLPQESLIAPADANVQENIISDKPSASGIYEINPAQVDNFSAEIENQKVNEEYKDSNLKLDIDNQVKIDGVGEDLLTKELGPKEGIIYRLPKNNFNYKVVGGEWYKDTTGKGNWTKLKGDTLAKRTKFLNENAVFYKHDGTHKEQYPIYKVPGNDSKYQNRGGIWYRDVNGKGNFVKLTQGDVKKRSEYLDKVAIVVSSNAAQKAISIIEPTFGELRTENTDAIITGGGDPVKADGVSFKTLTSSNTADETEEFNQDGTKNFNYDPASKSPLYIKKKEDGMYAFPGSSNSYKKEDGKWYAAVKGSKDYKPITTGNVEERISLLESKAFKPIKINEAIAVWHNEYNFDPLNVGKIAPNQLEQAIAITTSKKLEDYKTSFNNASEFISKDLGLMVKDNLSLDQRTSLIDYQKQIKKIIGDGTYTTAKGIAVSKLLKETEKYFEESKEINKAINEAYQKGESLSKIALDDKLKTYKENLGANSLTQGEYQRQAIDMFEASSVLAEFLMQNVDSGKMRYDSKIGQYIYSPNISEIERNYLENQFNYYITEYEAVKEEKYAQTNENIRIYKKNLSDVLTNINKLENEMKSRFKYGAPLDLNTMFGQEYAALSSKLKSEKGKVTVLESLIDKTELSKGTVFLTEPKKTALKVAKNLSDDATNIISAIPTNITAKEKFDLFYQRLESENKKIAEDNKINVNGFGAISMSFKDLFDWDGFYQLSPAEKRYLKNEATLNQLAPLYYNNDNGFTEASTGFFESFMNSFYSALFPYKAKAMGYANQSEIAQAQEKALQEEGFAKDDFVDANTLQKIKEKAIITNFSREGAGQMLGTTSAIMIPLLLTRKIGSGAIKLLGKIEKYLVGVNSTKAIDTINKAEAIYNRTLSTTKLGRFLKPVIAQGVEMEAAGRFVGSSSDELYFLGGIAGGIGAGIFEKILGVLPVDQAYNYLYNIFGSETNRVVKALIKSGQMASQGVAETAEEVSQELANIYKSTDSFSEMKAELNKRYGTLDQIQEFVISTIIMGSAFGLMNKRQVKSIIDRLPEEKKTQVMKIISDIQSDLSSAEESVNEFINNKEAQEVIDEEIVAEDNKIKEYDTENKPGVSGEVTKGKEPIQSEPVVGTSQEATSPSGVVQETPTEVKPNNIVANSFEEATKLFNEGYRPLINGKVQEGNLVGLESLFNTMPSVEMQKETPSEEVETLRAEEQTELADAMPNIEEYKVDGEIDKTLMTPDDLAKYNEIYDKYDKLITPLLTTEETTTPEERKSLADKIREGKIGKDGMAMSTIPGFKEVWNTVLETIALAVEGKENVWKAIDNAYKSIKESDWYKDLSKEQRQQASKDFHTGIIDLAPKQPVTRAERQAAKEFKDRVDQATGTAKPEATINLTPSEAIKRRYRDLAEGGKLTKKALQDIKKEIRDYAKENLPKEKYTKAEINAIASYITNATETNVEETINRIDDLILKKAEKAENLSGKEIEAKRIKTARDLKKRILSKRTILTKRGVKWVGKITIDSQKEYNDFIKRIEPDTLIDRTQEELDEINDIIDGILGEGKADFDRLKKVEDEAKRRRAAKLIEGLAGSDKINLNGIDEIKAFFEKDGEVVIDGQLYNKSSFKELVGKLDSRASAQKAIDDLKEINNSLKEAYNERLSTVLDEGLDATTDVDLKNILSELEKNNKKIKAAELKYQRMPIPDINIGKAEGYRQLSNSYEKESAKNKERKFIRRWTKFLNPTRMISDVYSLLKSAYSGNSEVAKFVKKKLIDPIEKAYFERDEAYRSKIIDYNKNLDAIFGKQRREKSFDVAGREIKVLGKSGARGVKRLSSTIDVNPSTIKTTGDTNSFIITNGNIVDWYNLSLSNADIRLEKAGIDVEAVKKYMNDPKNADLLAYSDYIMELYKSLGKEYEPTYELATNKPYPESQYPYYPSYSESFDKDLINPETLIDQEGKFNLMNASSNNMKDRVDFTGPLNISMDAHSKVIDYIKGMEHAKHFLPIAKSTNELFSKINSPYLMDKMGYSKYQDLKDHLTVILSDSQVQGYKGAMSKVLNSTNILQVFGALAFKPSSIIKQYTGFTHYWVAGVDKGIVPLQAWTGVPLNKNEWNLWGDLLNSSYLKERFKGENIDLEVQRVMNKTKKSKGQKLAYWTMQTGLFPVKLGDFSAIVLGPGGGMFYATSIYRKGIADGMTHEEAKRYAYQEFVTETEKAQQSSRNDVTSMVQRDPNFRMMATYRTGQMAAMKKVVTGMTSISQAYKIQMAEGAEARRAAIPDREIIKSIVDMLYFSTISSLAFAALSTGAYKVIMGVDGYNDDEAERAMHDVWWDQIQADLQGLGVMGYFADQLVSSLRGDDWKNNIPVIKKIFEIGDLVAAGTRTIGKDFNDLTSGEQQDVLLNSGAPVLASNPSQEEAQLKALEDYNSSMFWSKMSDEEIASLVKVIGGANISNFIEDMGKWSEGEKDLMDVMMHYDEYYFTKPFKGKKEDWIFERGHGKKYLWDYATPPEGLDYKLRGDADVLENQPPLNVIKK